MKILAIEQNVVGVTDAEFTPELLEEEAAQAWELHQTGVIRELYFRADRKMAVMMLECPNVEGANAVLSTLPLMRRRLIDFDVIPLSSYDGFARLFKSQLTEK